MKRSCSAGCILSLLSLFSCVPAQAQYYYKDIVVNTQARAGLQRLASAKVMSVNLVSTESNGQPAEGFDCHQTISRDFLSVTTFSQSPGSPASVLLSSYNSSGLLIRSVDTSETYQSTTEYRYDATGRISEVFNTALETDNHVTATELHIWKYNESGFPTAMIKVKDVSDTTYVTFSPDEKGHVAEERTTHLGQRLEPVYYYYDDSSRLTDIVRFNEKAKRLLPDYVFEYRGSLISSMLFVPAGTSEYLKWYYEYNNAQLRIRDRCFNKRDQPIGRIDYQYNYQ